MPRPNNIAFRKLDLEARAQGDEQLVPCVISTENPVEREGYLEILEHSVEAVDLSRAPLPLIESHNESRTPVGTVRGLRVEDRKLRGDVQFSKSARGRELLQDVLDGVLRSLSVAYRIKKWRENGDQVIATRWQPFEASCVAVPADAAAGFYRSQGNLMNTENTEDPKLPVEAILKTYQRFIEGDEGALRERAVAMETLNRGAGISWLEAQILAKVQALPVPSAEIGLSNREERRYSVVNAIQLQLDPARASREGGLEIEVSRELDKQAGKPARGIRVPFRTGKRDLTTSTASYLVPTETGELIDILRHKMILTQLGVTLLGGLRGNIVLPRKTASATSYWVAENSAPTEGAITFDSVSLTPKTCAAYVDFSRRFGLQTSTDAERLVRDDLMASMARALDSAAIGTTVTNGPTGIRGTSGIGSVAIGANGGAPTWAVLVNLAREVEIDNAAGSKPAYLSNDKVRAKLLQTPRQASGVEGNFLLNESGTIAGQPFNTSNQVPSNLDKGTSTGVCSAIFYGDWSQLIWATWGNSFDLLVDPYTGSKEGTVRVVCFTDVDFALRHPEAMAVCEDVLTT